MMSRNGKELSWGRKRRGRDALIKNEGGSCMNGARKRKERLWFGNLDVIDDRSIHEPGDTNYHDYGVIYNRTPNWTIDLIWQYANKIFTNCRSFFAVTIKRHFCGGSSSSFQWNGDINCTAGCWLLYRDRSVSERTYIITAPCSSSSVEAASSTSSTSSYLLLLKWKRGGSDERLAAFLFNFDVEPPPPRYFRFPVLI